MKARSTIFILVVLCATLAVGYRLGYEHGRHASAVKLTPVKGVGLAFRSDRNDIATFSATGSVSTPSRGR
jgi:hypothetical protein